MRILHPPYAGLGLLTILLSFLALTGVLIALGQSKEGARDAIARKPANANRSLRDAFADVNGVRLHYRVGGTGPVVLLLHGLTQTGQFWNSLAPELLTEYQVVIPDLRGHGQSTNPSGVYRHADVASDIFALLDQLKIEKISAVGHSSGACVLLHMATREPARVERMVLIGLGHRITDQTAEAFRQFPHFSEWPPSWQKATLAQNPPGGEAQINATVDYIRKLDRSDLTFNNEQLARVQANTLIAFGDRDGHPVEIAVELYRAIPHSQLWIVPNQGHTPFWPEFDGSELAAAEFPKVVKEFLGHRANATSAAP